MKSPFEIMFEKISQSSTKQVAEIVEILGQKSEPTKEEAFVRFVASCVLEERETQGIFKSKVGA
jgi:translation elongation factor P/translation initiation factor 5A